VSISGAKTLGRAVAQADGVNRLSRTAESHPGRRTRPVFRPAKYFPAAIEGTRLYLDEDIRRRLQARRDRLARAGMRRPEDRASRRLLAPPSGAHCGHLSPRTSSSAARLATDALKAPANCQDQRMAQWTCIFLINLVGRRTS
jgi:hypothetical protein